MTEKELKEHNKFLNIAEEIASDSKCVQLHVGAVLVKDKRIISTGYNGTPKDFINCDEYFKNKTYTRDDHHNFSELFEIHAELNAIIYAAKSGIDITGSCIYVTHQPCKNCLKMLCGAGIKNIYYRYAYDKADINDMVKNMLQMLDINLIHISKNI
jgi:dCMP deaminase